MLTLGRVVSSLATTAFEYGDKRMSLPRWNSLKRLTTAVLLAGAFSIGGLAQDSAQPLPTAPQAPQPASMQGFVVKDYSKPESHFPNPIAPYMPRHVSPPDLSNTPRIDQLMQNGKLMISIDDAVALAL